MQKREIIGWNVRKSLFFLALYGFLPVDLLVKFS